MTEHYKVYLVGGAVRDALLNHQVRERDWVVVGATPQDLIDEGYQQIGKDFPVFLHPKTKEEYALARAERKIAKGYTGFSIDASPNITLEEDLCRRDLTINAIAQDNEGNLIDPYDGVRDLNKRILRHVSNAFVEDPVRVLRLARFYARYRPYGFVIADETKALVQKIIASGELNSLVPERIWMEFSKALSEKMPEEFFKALRELNCLHLIFPELDALFGIPQTAKYHPEVDSGIHVLMTIEEVAKITDDLPTRFAVVCHDFGKAITPKKEWPSHKLHELRGISLVKNFCERLKVPNEFRDIAIKVTKHHLLMHQVEILRPKTLLKLILNLDALRRPQNLYRFIDACEADAKGRLGFRNKLFPQRDYLVNILHALQTLNVQEIISDVDKELIPQKINDARINLISNLINNRTDN